MTFFTDDKMYTDRKKSLKPVKNALFKIQDYLKTLFESYCKPSLESPDPLAKNSVQICGVVLQYSAVMSNK